MKSEKYILHALVLVLMAIAPVAWSQDDANRVEVKPGDTLFGIVRMHYPGQPSRWSLIENEIFLANPHAFSDDNKSLLRVGAILDMPVYETPDPDVEAKEEAIPEPAPQALQAVGAAIGLSGKPLAIDINNRRRTLALGDNVFLGDVVLTEGDSAAHFRMDDGAQYYLRAGSQLVIDDYRFVENVPGSNRSALRLLSGGLRAITGQAGQQNPAAVNIVTAISTIGIRGTDFAVRVCGPDECFAPGGKLFPAGDYAGVLAGEITVTNATGTTPVAPGQVVHTASQESSPVPALDAASLIFTESELALLAPKKEEPMNFFQWLHSWIFGGEAD